MRPRAPNPILQLLLAGALGAAAALGCGGHDDARGRPKPPSPAASAAPSATAPVVPVVSAEPLPSSAPEDPLAPPSAEISRALFSIPSDPAPPSITMNTHYVVSNEDRPEAFRDPVVGRGGVYVGVGAEQSFLLGGWSRADLLFLMDFDEWVVDINEVHGLVFQHARTPDELFALWGPEHAAEIKAWIEEGSPDHATAERRAKVYDRRRAQVQYRLKWLRRRLASPQVPSFVNDQSELDHIARLWRNKRVRCVRGDLTASGTLRAFGALARKAGWVVRVLYLSNAELYFDYDAGSFRDNLRSLPFDERSVVLHTQPTNRIDYFYIWQDARAYVPWMGRVRNFRGLLYESRIPLLGKLENGAWLIKPP